MNRREKEEIDRLRYELTMNTKLVEHLQKATKPVYVAREKKLSKLSGIPKKDTGPLVSDWINDAKERLNTINNEKVKVEFLMEHISGAAKDELRVRPKQEKDTAEKILNLIHILYDEIESISQIQQTFVQRNQRGSESLEDYSLTLLKIANQIIKRSENALGDKDIALKDRFVEGILD
jgi:hypothetical protein